MHLLSVYNEKYTSYMRWLLYTTQSFIVQKDDKLHYKCLGLNNVLYDSFSWYDIFCNAEFFQTSAVHKTWAKNKCLVNVVYVVSWFGLYKTLNFCECRQKQKNCNPFQYFLGPINLCQVQTFMNLIKLLKKLSNLNAPQTINLSIKRNGETFA